MTNLHEKIALRTSGEVVAAAKALSAKGYSDHDVAKILKIEVGFCRRLIGLSSLLAKRFD